MDRNKFKTGAINSNLTSLGSEMQTSNDNEIKNENYYKTIDKVDEKRDNLFYSQLVQRDKDNDYKIVEVIEQGNEDKDHPPVIEQSNEDKDYLPVIEQGNEDKDYLHVIEQDNEDKDYLSVIGQCDEDRDYQSVIDHKSEYKDYLQVIDQDNENTYLQLSGNERNYFQERGLETTKHNGLINVINNLFK